MTCNAINAMSISLHLISLRKPLPREAIGMPVRTAKHQDSRSTATIIK
jgi:hypothetical protein